MVTDDTKPFGWRDEFGPWSPVLIDEHDEWFWEYNAGQYVYTNACRRCGSVVGRGGLYTRLHINWHLGLTGDQK